MTGVNPDDFKGAMGSWAAGVTIVTTKLGGHVYGITASSFSSLSVDPLLVLVCIANSNKLASMVQETKSFAISILAEGQEDVSGYFAKSGREPVEAFPGITTRDWHTGNPIIEGAIAHLDCELHEIVPGGDHVIAVGRVVGAAYDPEQKPLLYFRRGYRSLNMD
jgi:flavin reductase (DIM6/NTAB) family NADH-FMN oxidoreductase RutF